MTECGQTLEETDAELAQEISDLMDEYGKNELGLSEGWWADQGDAESILVKLNEKRYEGK